MNIWRERLGRWFRPVARRMPLSPNAISVIAMLVNLAAAGLLFRGWFLTAIPLIIVAGLADALDGIVARVQQKETRFGDFLDHFADRVSDILLAASWLVGSRVRELLVVAAIVAVMLDGYVGTQLEATFRTRNYESVGRGEFVLALIVFPIFSHIVFANGWQNVRAAALTIPEWLTVMLIVFAVVGIVQRFALARKLERA
jgi:phosphatidylglycerophosphate synthase